MPGISAFRLMQFPVAGTEAALLPLATQFSGPQIDPMKFVFSIIGSGGIADSQLRSEVRAAYRLYLAEIVSQSSPGRGGIDWSNISTFSILAENQAASTEPIKIVRIYEHIPQINESEIQVLIDFISHNKNAQLFIQINGGVASELSQLESDLRREILRRRKATGVESKGVNVKAISTDEAYLKGLRVSSSRALVYGNNAGELTTLFSSIPVDKRNNTLFVWNHVTHVAPDELEEASDILAALFQIFSPKPLLQGIVSVDLLSERIAIAVQLQALVKQAA